MAAEEGVEVGWYKVNLNVSDRFTAESQGAKGRKGFGAKSIIYSLIFVALRAAILDRKSFIT